MDMKALMDELLEHGCILQSREDLTKAIIEKHVGIEPAVEPVVDPYAFPVNDIAFPERQAEQEEKEPEDDHAE